MKTQKTILIAAIALILAAVPATNAYAHGTVACTTITKYLSQGARDANTGGAVTQLQNFLHISGYLSSEPTGYFGPLTFKAVQAFQAKQGFETVGATGPLTRAAIQKISCASKPAATNQQAETQSTAAVVEAVAPVSSGVPLPYHTQNFSAWKGTWGTATLQKSGSLLGAASASGNGAEMIFEKGAEWTNYRYTARFVVSNGDATLIARYVDENNFVACTFYRNEIAIKQRVNGVTTTLATKSIPEVMNSVYFHHPMSVSLRVVGNMVGCSMIGTADNVTAYGISDTLKKGTIGIQTYSPALGAATLELKEVTVASTN